MQWCGWPRGLMDKASDFESEDCEFESRRGRLVFVCWLMHAISPTVKSISHVVHFTTGIGMSVK